MRRNLATRSFWAVVCCLTDLLTSPAFAAGGEEHGLISLDWSLLIQGVNFLLLLVLLTKILYRPLLAKMNERTQAIQKSLDEAQQARAEAQKERDEFAAKIQAAYAEAQGIRAAALKDAADEQRRLVDAARGEAAGHELAVLLDVLKENRQAVDVLTRPWIKPEDRRAAALTLAQQAGCGKLVQDFVALVAERGRLDHLAAIVAAYKDMEDAGLGRVRAQVTTAVSLTDAEKDQLKQHLQAELHKQIIPEESVDTNPPGGF